MSDLNLIPQELKAAEELKKKKIRITLLAITGLLILAAASCVPIYLSFIAQSENIIVENRINELSDVKKQVDLLNQQRSAAQERLNTYGSLPGKDRKWSEVLNEISKIIPQDVTIKSFTGGSDGITLQCSSPSMQSIAVFYANIENDKMFSSLKINDITPDKESNALSFGVSLVLTGSKGKVN